LFASLPQLPARNPLPKLLYFNCPGGAHEQSMPMPHQYPAKTCLSNELAMPYLGEMNNPIDALSFEGVNTSLFKSWPTFKSWLTFCQQRDDFRVDILNVPNTPSRGTPGITNNDATEGISLRRRTFSY
jgi:hypothetical protein